MKSSPSISRFDRLKRYGAALGLGVLSGWLASLAGLPLPWMLGPMIGNTVAALAGAPTLGPLALRPIVIPIIGVMLGSGFKPEIFEQIGDWVSTLAILPVFIALAAGSVWLFYRRVGGYDPVTAYFSAMPGGFNEMILLGAEAGGDDRKIALAHAVRILFVVSFVALFFGVVVGVSSQSSGGQGVPLTGLTVLDAAVLTLCAVAGVYLGRLLRLPAANLLGPMLLSSAAHLATITEVPPPNLLIVAAQIVIGTIIGCRFVGARLKDIGRDMMLGAGASLIAIAAAVLCAELVVLMTGLPLSLVFLAFSPGGLTEMSLLAVALGQNIAYVSLAHVARIVMVIFAAPLAFRLGRGWFNQKP
ncbi:MAG: AbrB family transcriptional regulator [Pseudomonadota bacterium]